MSKRRVFIGVLYGIAGLMSICALVLLTLLTIAYVLYFYKLILLVLALGIIVILIFELTLLYIYRKPLSYSQIEEIAYHYTQKYLEKKYMFSKRKQHVDKCFMNQAKITGNWYPCNISVSKFPSFVSRLLNEKQFEWVVVGLESKGIVKYFWLNRGEDASNVGINCTLSEITSKCKENDCYTILRLHNHPNPNPTRYNTLLASVKDISSAQSCSGYFSDKGINWLDFVCAQGKFFCFYRNMSPFCQIPGNTVSEIIDDIGISLLKDSLIKQRYICTTSKYKVFRKAFLPFLLTLLVIFSVSICGNRLSQLNLSKKSMSNIVPEEVISETSGTVAESSVINISEIPIKSVVADSEYISNSGKDYSAQNLIDGDWHTCWQDGTSGDGVGEKLSFEFEKTSIFKIGIVNGNRSYDGAYNRNNRLSAVVLQFYSGNDLVMESEMKLSDDEAIEIEVFELGTSLECDKLIIIVDSVYEGTSYSDTGVSEIIVYGAR